MLHLTSTVAYNVGLYSQYIFRGLTQTDRGPAVQGGVDLTHSSGFYLGAWASNISWLRDTSNAWYCPRFLLIAKAVV